MDGVETEFDDEIVSDFGDGVDLDPITLQLTPEACGQRLDKVIAGRKDFSTFVEGIVKQGMADGDFDASLDLTLSTSMVFELMKSSHLYRRPRANIGLTELADSYSVFAIHGLGAANWQPPTPG